MISSAIWRRGGSQLPFVRVDTLCKSYSKLIIESTSLDFYIRNLLLHPEEFIREDLRNKYRLTTRARFIRITPIHAVPSRSKPIPAAVNSA